MNQSTPIGVLDDYQPRAGLLDDRVILVTGANRGIGRAVALHAARAGARLILSGRNVAALEKVDDEIRAAGGAEPSLMPLDLLKATIDDYRAAARAVEEAYGRLDGLAHVAGLLGARSTIEHYPPMEWHNVMHVNASAVFLMTQALLPLLQRAEDGSVVLASSSVGRKGRAHWGAYSVSKFAVEGFMQVLADECDGHPRINSLNPGATRTGMRRAAYPAEDPTKLRTPDDIVGGFLYLLGPDSAGVNGRAFDCQPPRR